MTAPNIDAAAWLRARLADGLWRDSSTVLLDAAMCGVDTAAVRMAAIQVCNQDKAKWRLKLALSADTKLSGRITKRGVEVEAWLRNRLADGEWHRAEKVKQDGTRAGIQRPPLQRYSTQLCEKRHEGHYVSWRLRRGAAA